MCFNKKKDVQARAGRGGSQMKNYNAIILQKGLRLDSDCDNTTFLSHNTGDLINNQINRVMAYHLRDKDISSSEFQHGTCD